MANVIKKATNKFTKGLVMDFSPENTKNEVLTNALNATLLTFNGNELSLQNDMGNARVESAFLPEGYIPVGTCEYGGIIYIVSYNPLEDKSLIGCFPSPERNISREEMGRSDETSVSYTDFLEINMVNLPSGNLKNVTRKILLKDSSLNPGDKFIVYADEKLYDERILDLYLLDEDEFTQIDNPMVSLNLVSILDNGKIIYLNSDIKKYEVKYSDKTFKYHILGQVVDLTSNNKVDVDSYRNVLSSGYSVFKEKTSGKLALLVELVTIDSFSLTHNIERDGECTIDGVDCYTFKVTAHPEVSPEINKDNYNTSPKLKFYSFDNVRGSVLCILNGEFKQINYGATSFDDLNSVCLFKNDELECPYIFTGDNVNTYQSLLYTSIGNLSWDFIWSGSKAKLVTSNTFEDAYFKMNEGNIYVLTKEQFKSFPFSGLLFAINISEDGKYSLGESINESMLDKYKHIAIKSSVSVWNSVRLTSDVYLKPGINYFEGYEDDRKIEEETPFKWYKSEYLPDKETGVYDDIHLATFNLPKLLVDNNVNIPFKYDYTITPCMEYGKLDFLSVSNTIDLNNLYDFDASNFTTWKYRIDGELLMLTVGADVFDTFETHKVDGLFFEFYDWRGFAGSLEITGKKSYSGKFTKLLPLNSVNILSKNKLVLDSITKEFSLNNSFVRNVNILENSKELGKYYYNEKEVTYLNDMIGWYEVIKDDNGTYTYNSSNKKYEKITEENPNTDGDTTYSLQPFTGDNDCGVLYSNLIYGVKPYLRRIVNDKTEYIKKDDMFLFTMPLYNDHYYNISNFNTLVNPKLNLVLTYKLQDTSKAKPFESEDLLNGYTINDYVNTIQPYILGKFSTKESNRFNTKRYFAYKGTTELLLEIGLLKEYESYNLSCMEDINNYFSGNLELINDSDLDKSFRMVSGENNETVGLDEVISENSQWLKFIHTDKETFSVLTGDLTTYNFISNPTNKTSIQVDYRFVVGYEIDVINIGLRQVPATTVCALFHQDETGSYNYDDFGIHVINNGDYDVYAPSIMYYNSGTADTEIFGLCKMVDIAGTTINDLCMDLISTSKIALPISSDGKLNAGSLLREVVGLIGKLLFCLPHAHSLQTSYINNITAIDGGKFIADSLNTSYQNLADTYNMCANTQRCINNNTEFISTVSGVLLNGETQFTGLYGNELAKFNRCMLETMKNVYTYNPDYDLIKINKGDVNVTDKAVKVLSNIICTNASLGDAVLTNYLRLGSVDMSTYLYDLLNMSGVIVASDITKKLWIPTLNFEADLKFVGNPDAYLISSLTYNLPVPQQIYDDLELDFSSSIVVRHTDGSHDFMIGEIDKKSLYGYSNKFNKLVLLDVKNYTIDLSSGSLSVIEDMGYEETSETITIEINDDDCDTLSRYEPLTKQVTLSSGQSARFSIAINLIQGEFSRLGLENRWVYGYSAKLDNVGTNKISYTIDVTNLAPYADVYGTVSFLSNLDMDILYVYINQNTGKSFGDSLVTMNDITNASLYELDDVYLYPSPYDVYYNQGKALGYSSLFDGIELDGKVATLLIAKDFGGNPVGYWEHIPDSIEYNTTTVDKNEAYTTYVPQNCLTIIVARIKIPQSVSFEFSFEGGLHYVTSDVVPYKKTLDWGSVSSDSGYVNKQFGNAYCNLVGSTITLNDLLYIPEVLGHRLFMKSDRFTPKPGNPIWYRLSSENIGEIKCNALKLFLGPCYKTSIDIKETDPEYIKK